MRPTRGRFAQRCRGRTRASCRSRVRSSKGGWWCNLARQVFVEQRTATHNRIRGWPSELPRLGERIREYQRHIGEMARQDQRSQQLTRLRGIGETTATAMVGNGRDFQRGSQLSAWIGLVPGQYNSGSKKRLGRTTKAEEAYLRSLLILGARAVLNAAKSARMDWAVLRQGERFLMPV